jgi:hypothetical protein
MLFLDGVYVDSADGSNPQFRPVKAPTSAELTQLTHTIAQRVARCLERQDCWNAMPRTAICLTMHPKYFRWINS